MYIIFEAYGTTFRMNTNTGETWRLSADQWVLVPEFLVKTT